MSTVYRWCRCGALVWPTDHHHTCSPVWLVYSAEYGELPEDARRIHAADAQRATETATQKHFWSFDSGYGPFELLVRPEANESVPWETYTVDVEMTPVFSAKLKTKSEAAQ